MVLMGLHHIKTARLLYGRLLCLWDSPGKNTVVISSTRGSSWLTNRTDASCISCVGRQILYHCAAWEAQNTEYVCRILQCLEVRRVSSCLPAWDSAASLRVRRSGGWKEHVSTLRSVLIPCSWVWPSTFVMSSNEDWFWGSPNTNSCVCYPRFMALELDHNINKVYLFRMQEWIAEIISHWLCLTW